MAVIIMLLVVFVSNGIMARPTDIIREKRHLVSIEGIPKQVTRMGEAESHNTFLLPKVFGLNDVVTVYIELRNSKTLNISLIMDDEAIWPLSTPCSLVLKEETITIFNNGVDIDLIEANRLINGSEFIVGFQRILQKSSQEANGLKIRDTHKNTAYEMEVYDNMDKVKYIQINGDNIKVKKLNFEFE